VSVVADEVRAVARPAVRLRSDRGDLLPLEVDRWYAEPSDAEHEVLSRAIPPVLDVGCGPARHTLALRARGVPAVGVDVAAGAVRVARGRGAPVLHRSVFDRLPNEGAWGTALLLDGNIGIGGDPVSLLARIRRVLRSRGRVLLELDRPGTPTDSFLARIEGSGSGSWFPWARVGTDAIATVAREAGLVLREVWEADDRWFGCLDRRPP
jgi:SAM-dependent methyltransferase